MFKALSWLQSLLTFLFYVFSYTHILVYPYESDAALKYSSVFFYQNLFIDLKWKSVVDLTTSIFTFLLWEETATNGREMGTVNRDKIMIANCNSQNYANFVMMSSSFS